MRARTESSSTRSATGARRASARRDSPCAPAAGGRWAGCSHASRSRPRRRSWRTTPGPAPHGCGRSRWPTMAKGRHWVAAWLVAFLVTTWVVYARQTAAIRAARELADLRARRANLEAHRADLERRIRAAQGRNVLVPRAQQHLRLHLPSDSEIILLPAPSGSH